MSIHKTLVTRFVFAAMLGVAVAATGCGSDGENGGSGGSAGSAGTGGTGGGTGGTGGIGGIGGTGGTGGSAGPGVNADPAGSSFTDPVEVTLSVSGEGSEGATIYYTTDLSPVLDEEGNVQGTEYDGPITISETTVLKFLAQAADSGTGGAGGSDGAISPEQSEGYTLTTNPILEQWAESGHGDITAEAWRHWDADGEVPSHCAKCHSAQSNSPPVPSVGFLEFARTGENTLAAPLPLGLDCAACHERFPTIYSDLETYGALEPVEFPSGAELSLYSSSNICMSCHQGRESGESVEDRIADSDPPYSFVNIHYYPAAASMFGSEANGGVEYAGLDYRPRNTFPSHPNDAQTCVGCHMERAENDEQHTWNPGLDTCTGCHGGDSFESLGGSPEQSFDNIDALLPDLYAAIQGYADTELGAPIIYDGHAYPYWFNDNGMGANYGNRYQEFDAALLRAAYNYQVGLKDPAGYVHNGTYIQQILHDSTVDLGGSTDVEVIGRGDLTIDGAEIGSASKTQQWQLSGHAAADEEPFRHWDDSGSIPGSCVKCHSTPGFVQFVDDVPTTAHAPTTTVDCSACHESVNLFTDTATRFDGASMGDPLDPVEFPSTLTATFNNDSNMCMACHQGRSSKKQVDEADPNTVSNGYDSYDFINIHYYAAAAILFGTDVQGGYEYDEPAGLPYRGQNEFVGVHDEDGLNLVDCVGCHMNSDTEDAAGKHTFLPEVADCNGCHSGSTFPTLRTSPERNFDDISILKQELMAAIQDYATTGGLPQNAPVFYDSHAYPYWFNDNGNGANYGNRYRAFDFDMLTAAYNFVVADKDPAGYIHNGIYVTQLLYDSIVRMGGTPTVRPPDRPFPTP